MHTIGIIAEYNPFHSGHHYHIQEVRRTFGQDCAVVCAMSGNWVQRGEAAITDKWTRSLFALQGGADLILEIPTPWAVSSAETFAQSGVSLLDATGLVDTISFGSEAGQLAPLQAVAACIDSPTWQEHLREGLRHGLSFPAARQKAVSALLGPDADCLRTPNNNLAVEYLRAMERLGSPMAPHTLSRLGAGHDADDPSSLPHASASYLRQQIITEHPRALSPFLPADTEAVLRQDPASLAFCTQGILARLRTMTEADLARLPDSGEGLSQRLYAAVQTAATLPELYDLTKTKRYPMARIRRLVLWAFLGLTETDRPQNIPYLRVLGFSPRGQLLLRQMKHTAALPILTKPAHAEKLSHEVSSLFHLEARCTLLYDLCRKSFGQSAGKNEYTQNPIRV
ncbi:MAG: nucleotidyltransferase family protein [Evtepia sp.]|uniref:tRNA(Met) cytidine acetate ligase n=1 Tax=Evtepia sp. TaxID=2773933 RepID=UPI002A7514D6|nr:nucleotidyltransferase family protein [Evtepia sp.]MDY3014187.1 nucleotidyltransferase family protein [Evtepia sp.]